MNNIKVFSKNATYQKFEVLKSNRTKRHRYGQFLIEGVNNINQAILKGWEICSFIFADNGDKHLSNWATDVINKTKTQVNYELTKELMEDLSEKDDTSEILAIVKTKENNLNNIELSQKPLVAVFDRPSNHGNLGTVIRSCDAFGVDCLIITGHCVDMYDINVIRSSMGSFFKLPVFKVETNDELTDFINGLKKRYLNFQVIGSTAHKENIVTNADLTTPIMLMIGNETDGLNKTLKETCDLLVTIPMGSGCAATSFNVGCAASVMLYEIIRQRMC